MNREYRRESDLPVELESQFILRMPEEPAKLLRELLQSGASLKDRLTIRVENDMRFGEVRVDHWLMHAKIVDLPGVIESLKTIDNKSLYKTADICQMMICKEEPDQPSIEEESPTKAKKKDPYKVEKKFLWPHGITPPAKNVRKRRFRKTLKKKYVEAPEIEKEVKRLLRVDNEAVNVSWEVIADEEDFHMKQEPGGTSVLAGSIDKSIKVKSELLIKSEPDSDQLNQDMSNADVEHDIFGGAVSDSDLDDEEEAVNVEMDDTSRPSAYDSRLSDSNSMQGMHLSDSHNAMNYPTQFRSDMFANDQMDDMQGMSGAENTLTRENINERIHTAREELTDLQARKMRTEQEIASMDNLALRNRFQEILKSLNEDILFKELEVRELLNLQSAARH